MSNNRKSVLAAICMILYATIMTALVWFLKQMSLDFVLGANAGFFFALGLFFLISREFRLS